jgi:hypothetical protein
VGVADIVHGLILASAAPDVDARTPTSHPLMYLPNASLKSGCQRESAGLF